MVLFSFLCVIFCVQARASHVSPPLSVFFFSFSFFVSDSCLTIITSLTFLLHISVHSSCTLIVNTLQNRVIVQPAAVNPSIVAKHKIAMRGHTSCLKQGLFTCRGDESEVHTRNKQIKHNDDQQRSKHSNLKTGKSFDPHEPALLAKNEVILGVDLDDDSVFLTSFFLRGDVVTAGCVTKKGAHIRTAKGQSEHKKKRYAGGNSTHVGLFLGSHLGGR